MGSIKHLAIIMDGNGRWAEERNLKRTDGHKAGSKASLDIIHAAIDAEIEVLTLYAFSTENWHRPQDEVSRIMSILDLYLEKQIFAFLRRGVRFKVIGDKQKLSRKTRFLIKNAEFISEKNKGMLLQLALSYGGQDEILRAIHQLAADGVDMTTLSKQQLTEALDTGVQQPVDLVIRTSGEQRLSNFLIWQTAYAEFYFSDKHWPDFDTEELHQAFDSYNNRSRRFGKTQTQMNETAES